MKHNGDVIAKPERYFSYIVFVSPSLFWIFLSHLSCQKQQQRRIEIAKNETTTKELRIGQKMVLDSFEIVATPEKTPSHFRTRKSRD